MKERFILDLGKIEAGVELILKGLDCELQDRNYRDTPERVARMYAELFGPKDREWATFPEDFNDFILLRGHTLYTMCPHHLLPVDLRVSIAYIPNGHVLGLSKLARVLDECNTGPVLQEKFTKDCLRVLLEICPGVRGAACLVAGRHDCTRIRGVRSDADFITYKLAGDFATDRDLEKRFFDLTRR
jgi:GTP cyclohydrolase I